MFNGLTPIAIQTWGVGFVEYLNVNEPQLPTTRCVVETGARESVEPNGGDTENGGAPIVILVLLDEDASDLFAEVWTIRLVCDDFDLGTTDTGDVGLEAIVHE